MVVQWSGAVSAASPAYGCPIDRRVVAALARLLSMRETWLRLPYMNEVASAYFWPRLSAGAGVAHSTHAYGALGLSPVYDGCETV